LLLFPHLTVLYALPAGVFKNWQCGFYYFAGKTERAGMNTREELFRRSCYYSRIFPFFTPYRLVYLKTGNAGIFLFCRDT
jgi:hypothetical protein